MSLPVMLTRPVDPTRASVAGSTVRNRLDPPASFILDEAPLICPVPLDRWTADAGGSQSRRAWRLQLGTASPPARQPASPGRADCRAIRGSRPRRTPGPLRSAGIDTVGNVDYMQSSSPAGDRLPLPPHRQTACGIRCVAGCWPCTARLPHSHTHPTVPPWLSARATESSDCTPWTTGEPAAGVPAAE